jgi:protein-S-isoprenylcysteine O-methyltransferase Ste14
MSEKMSLMGVADKIAVPILVYVAVAAAVSRLFSPRFRITCNSRALRNVGIAIACAGFSMNVAASLGMLKANSEGRLATGGFYRLFRDPMYVLQVFITLPGLFLLFNSWLVLAGVIPAYLAYRKFAPEEHSYLEAEFGQAYRDYVKTVLFKI